MTRGGAERMTRGGAERESQQESSFLKKRSKRLLMLGVCDSLRRESLVMVGLAKAIGGWGKAVAAIQPHGNAR